MTVDSGGLGAEANVVATDSFIMIGSARSENDTMDTENADKFNHENE